MVKLQLGNTAPVKVFLKKIEHPLTEIILEHRGLAKLKSTYTDRLIEQSHNDTHRVHTSYHQALTATGRLSSSDPNLQNIPIVDRLAVKSVKHLLHRRTSFVSSRLLAN